MVRRVHVVDENESGRNQRFYDPDRRRSMTRAEFVRRIEKGSYDDYHVRIINGLKTPRFQSG
jgi:hypothetical protein